MTIEGEPLYHVTALSNFARGFDKYTRQYRKSSIAESRYPRESYLVTADDLSVGIAKASRLCDKLGIPGNRPLVLRAEIGRSSVQPNRRNGVGLVWPSPDLPVAAVFNAAANGQLGAELAFEQAFASSLALHAHAFTPYAALRPRSVSFLPVARGCQAACPFCFSEASASVDQARGAFGLAEIGAWAGLARSRGAERAVITGGGEPTLLRWQRLRGIVGTSKRHFEKIVLITNGVRFSSLPSRECANRVHELALAGLSVLAVSRHHPREDVNAALMKLETKTPVLLSAAASVVDVTPRFKVRLICVLQRGGVASPSDVDAYVRWAANLGVREICFKELYVATSEESVYFSAPTNAWSARNQVPLTVVHEWAQANGLRESDRLPWGSPIFEGTVEKRPMRVAAYTEPTLFWERSHGVARSWNVMSDGTCLASLEDRRSDVTKLVAAVVH